MSGLYEQLLEEHGGGGLDTLALMNLPSSVRRVVRLMLRNKGMMTYPALCEAMDAMPEDERLSRVELDEILDALSRLGWFVREGGVQPVTYKVNLGEAGGRSERAPSAPDVQAQKEKPAVARERPGKEEASGILTKGKPRRRARRASIRDIWANLSGKTEQGKTSAPEEPKDPGS
jgi:hypothetical protein